MPQDPHPTSPAPLPEPRRTGGAGRLWSRIFSPFWMVPALCCIGAFAAGLILPEVDEALSDYVPFLFQSGPAGARAMLSTIAGAMISVTGLVFSITIVVLQLASSQFSPRVLRTFLDDRTPQVTLGVFTSSFVYSLTVMRNVSGSSDGDAEPVPQIALSVAFVLVLISVGMFLAFIHHITQAISVDTIIRTVGKDTIDLLMRGRAMSRDTMDDGAGGSGEEENRDGNQAVPGSKRQVVVLADSDGYLNYVDHHALIEMAARHHATITLLYPLGTYLVPSQPMALVTASDQDDDQDWPAMVRRRISLTWRRSMEQDISFGIRQLVDIGERALSPGVNDPTTAVQVTNELHSILHQMVVTGQVPTSLRDDDGVVRVISREWTFEQYLDLCVDEIAHWGASSLQMPDRLLQMLTQLQQIANPEQREILAAKVARVEDVVSRAQG